MKETKYPHNGIELIAAERSRQIQREGFTLKNDQQYVNGELYAAAMCYMTPEDKREYKIPAEESTEPKKIPVAWPFPRGWWRPTPENRIKELTKAGALLMAENARRGDKEYLPEVYECAHLIDAILRTDENYKRPFTWEDLRKAIGDMSSEQRSQEVKWVGTEGEGKIYNIDFLNETYVATEVIEQPLSAFKDGDKFTEGFVFDEAQVTGKRGDPRLMSDEYSI